MNAHHTDVITAIRRGTLTPNDREALAEFVAVAALTVDDAGTAPLDSSRADVYRDAARFDGLCMAFDRLTDAFGRSFDSLDYDRATPCRVADNADALPTPGSPVFLAGTVSPMDARPHGYTHVEEGVWYRPNS